MGNALTPSASDENSDRPLPFKITPDARALGDAEKKAETSSISQPQKAASATAKPTPSTFAAQPVSFEDLGELPSDYQTGNIYLAARDPHWLFVYWDINLGSLDRKLALDDEPGIYLKVFKATGDLIDQIRVNAQAKNWYFPIKEAGTAYYVELGFYDIASKWAVIGKSNETLAPSDHFTEGPVEFASVPFHLSFDRLLKIVQAEVVPGTSLVGALAHLQKANNQDIREISESWTDEQKRLLEVLVGPELISQIGNGSADADQIFRQRLGEALSETLSSSLNSDLHFLKNFIGVPWQESLFSGVGASWSAAAGESTSWSAAAGSSWSAQPFGSTNRDFFMHVNAEVIFYGGTHPEATVWIDGMEIALASDGSFRYHFRLPDGEFEIPIVAESPDGVETRSAKLVFKRGTGRVGDVGATDQPTYLDAPMGAL